MFVLSKAFYEMPLEVQKTMDILWIVAIAQAILACYYFNIPFYSSRYKCWDVGGWWVNFFVIIMLHIVIPITVLVEALLFYYESKDLGGPNFNIISML